MQPPQKLIDQLQRVAEQARATSAAVYLPTPWEPATRALLLQVGPEPPLAELASQEAAEAFAAEVAETGQWAGLIAEADGIVTSRAGDGVLIPVPLLTSLWAGGGVSRVAAPRRRQSDGRGASSTAGWVGLRLAARDASPAARANVQLAHSLAATVVSLYGLLTDPLTGLPGRNELHGALRLDLHRARRRRLPCALVLVNPIGLDWVNAQHGRRAGDAVVREVVQVLQSLLRRSDVLMRYGGAIFALPLGNVGAAGAMLVAERVRAHIEGRAFLNDAVRLRCAVGVVACEAGQAEGLDPLDLLRRANEALASARQQGGETVVAWHDAATSPDAPATDRLFGIFTGRTDKDYRNMGLLWDVLQVLSGARGSVELAQHVVERLHTLLRPERVGLFINDDAGPRLLVGQRRDRDGRPLALAAADVTEPERALMLEAAAAGEVRQGDLEQGTVAGSSRALLGIAVPLVTGGRVLGALLLVGAPEALDLDRTDLPVLTGVAAQLAVALDREHLAELHRVRAEHERRRLQAEVQDLRSALQQNQIVFQSAAMNELLSRARRVAATETTVLITGESGTGKERLAQAVHQLSARRHKPFVIVDCGAIPATLIDSELFGHERGAFTGAQQRSLGRLAQADGGTVLLDEIGELPLDVQSRLLRFVQEKTISMVGSTRARTVDVRIVAATNRRLEDEVRAGRFREDLFYRLNVVRLHIPPLRERPEDVRLLAEHFTRAFAAEQHKPVSGFSPEAERRVLAHAWPGNVRELRNTILQAVVLCEGDRLEAADLALPPAPLEEATGIVEGAAVGRASLAASADAVSAEAAAGLPLAEAPPEASDAREPADAWEALRACLDAEVRAAASARPRASWPLGRWLAGEVVTAALQVSGGVRARAAERVGLPLTTYTRRLSQAAADRSITTRPASWSAVGDALAAVLAAEDPRPGRLADRVDALLLETVVVHVPAHLAYAASLLDLSTPTLKRRLAARTASRDAG